MKKPRVLILHEDLEMGTLIAEQLVGEQFETDVNRSALDAIQKISLLDFEIVIVNWDLREKSCKEVILEMRRLKSSEQLSILVLTPHAEPEFLIQFFDAGADDFLSLPFDRQILFSRVHALFQRLRPVDYFTDEVRLDTRGRIRLGDIAIHPQSYDVFCKSERVHLTPSEFKLLHALALNKGKILTREKLVELVQGQGVVVVDRAIDTHVFQLRKKLGVLSDSIETVRGVGYRVRAVAAAGVEPAPGA